MVLPIFRSNFSLTSILTLEEALEKPKESSADSIFSLCRENSLEECFIADKTLTGLIDAYENAEKSGIKLRFGYRLNICQDMEDKTLESENTTSKIIIFSSKTSFSSLINIHNLSATKGIYNERPRIDYKTLKENWDDTLIMVIPFYDSYIHYNLLYGKQCVPDIEFTNPFYAYENNELPFDSIIQKALEKNIATSNLLKSKTIYYNKRSDFDAYMAYRCILNRTTFQKPELQHFGSKEFCMEAWSEQNI
jgi:DNA polymerase III alpha subunit